jgi:pSer/pThr/pTyr-binding forkhead associated (FHA) protein
VQLREELAESKRKLRKLRKRLDAPRPDPPRPDAKSAAEGDDDVLPLTFRWRDEDGEHQETLRRDIIKIGKLGSSHLRIADESVSRMQIEAQGNKVVIIDLGSSEGTHVNGKKVNKKALKDGDMLTLGRVSVVIGMGR